MQCTSSKEAARPPLLAGLEDWPRFKRCGTAGAPEPCSCRRLQRCCHRMGSTWRGMQLVCLLLLPSLLCALCAAAWHASPAFVSACTLRISRSTTPCPASLLGRAAGVLRSTALLVFYRYPVDCLRCFAIPSKHTNLPCPSCPHAPHWRHCHLPCQAAAVKPVLCYHAAGRGPKPVPFHPAQFCQLGLAAEASRSLSCWRSARDSTMHIPVAGCAACRPHHAAAHLPSQALPPLTLRPPMRQRPSWY